jgi:hypothetical protein
MSYWGSKADDCDYAFGAVGSYVYIVKDRMFKDAKSVCSEAFDEQSIIASLQIIRIIAAQFPKSVSVHFGRKHFEEARFLFAKWYDLVREKLPAKYRESIRVEAEIEFALFEERVLAPAKKDSP